MSPRKTAVMLNLLSLASYSKGATESGESPCHYDYNTSERNMISRICFTWMKGAGYLSYGMAGFK
jgi:hypothetical protein